MRALVTGATGFLGRRLVARLQATGASVSVLSRDADRARASLGGNVESFAWDPSGGRPPEAAFRSADGRPVDVVFHLAGEPVAEGRWTDDKKDRVLRSRQDGTRHLVETIADLTARPPLLVSASAVGFYGDRGDETLDEASSPGGDFLAIVCEAWEREAERAEALGVRVVRVRIGVVLGEGGGALDRMLTPFKLGLGGRLGSGAQWMPWVHVEDVVGLLLHAVATPSLRGPVNAVSPQPARNADFTRALGKALHRPAIFPVPAAALRLAFGELAGVLLASQRVLPRVAERSGYRFAHPDLPGALRATLDRAPR